MSVSNYLIYGLADPTTDEIRYVGKSCKGLERPGEHMNPGKLKYKSKKNSWIKNLKMKDLRPKIVVLEECLSADVLDEREIFWIKQHRDSGSRLTNGTDGGTGGNTGKAYKKHKPVIAVNILTGVEKRYDFVWQTELDGFYPSKVSAVCKGKANSHKGYVFHYDLPSRS